MPPARGSATPETASEREVTKTPTRGVLLCTAGIDRMPVTPVFRAGAGASRQLDRSVARWCSGLMRGLLRGCGGDRTLLVEELSGQVLLTVLAS